MRSRSQLLACAAALTAVALTNIAPAQQHNAPREEAKHHLSQRLARHASAALSAQQRPSLAAIEIATLLVREAVDLNPANQHAWRMLLQLAEMAEDVAVQDEALRALAGLDPHDEVIRLKRANRLIEQRQTVEQRIAAYNDLLAPNNRRNLGDAVASRLALDLALLHRRAGNSEQFAHWLAEAAAIDPSHRTAAAVAAGYFRANVINDAFAEGELLVSLLMADPIQVASQRALANHLLQFAAYRGATRMLTLAVNATEAGRMMPPPDLVADLAIAQWGAGDTEAALRTVRDFQHRADTIHRRQLQDQRPEMTSLERARESAVIDPTLAVIRAAIHTRLGTDLAAPSLARAVAAYERVFEDAEEAGTTDPDTDDQQARPEAKEIAQLKLELAWVLVSLDGGDIQRVRRLIAEAGEYETLSTAAAARFDGWLALREGDFDAAERHFQPHIANDAGAALGYATVLLKRGQSREAARELLRIAREQAGTIISVWAADLLWDLLGQRAVIASEVGLELERLVEKIPNVVDRFPLDPSTAFSIRLVPAQTTFPPYEPVILNVEISNHAPFPIAISADGPIRSHAVLNIAVEMVRAGRTDPLSPVVVDVSRRLRLMPRERLVIPLDLRDTALGELLDTTPMPGAVVRVKGILNFIVTPQGALLPGVLGTERETPPFRIDGFRLTGQLLEQSIAMLIDEQREIDLGQLASLCHISVLSVQDQPQAVRRLFQDARTAIIETYPRLDADTQAWMLSVLPRADAFAPIRDQARQSQHRAVQLSYLLHQVVRGDDPMLAAAERSGDRTLQRFAELLRLRFDTSEDDFYNQPAGK